MPSNTLRRLPAWMMALSGSSLGFVYGFISTAMGILLVSRGVPVAKVAAISAVAFSPTFWVWTLSPVLDVRFTKRTYCLSLATLAAVLLAVAVLCIGNLTWFTAAITASCAAACLFGNALGGWAPDLISDAEYDVFSGWVNIANLGAAGIFGALTIFFVRHMTLPRASLCLAVVVALPAWLLIPFFPLAPKPEGTLKANFQSMGRDLRRVARDGRVWVGLAMFLSPASCFALTNLFSSLGADFRTSEQWVTNLNGPGVAIACSVGCLIAIPLCRLMRRRTIYLAAGAFASVASIALALLPHVPPAYTACVLAYNFSQGFGYTAFNALQLEIIGPKNALAGTISAVLTASMCAPLSLMSYVEGRVHDGVGIKGMLLTDAGSSLGTVVLLVLLLPVLDRLLVRRKQNETIVA